MNLPANLPAIVGHEPADVTIIDPDTGEALSPHDATDEQIARWRRAVMDGEQVIRQAKQFVDAVVIERMDAEACWTVHAGGYTLSAPSPAPVVEYPDPEGLRRDLLALNGISQTAVDRAIRPVTVYRPQVVGLKRLRSLSRADVDEVLDRHAVTTERARRLTVKESA